MTGLSFLILTWLAVEPPGALWLDVPFVQQEKNGCGSASLAMVVDYWQGHGAAQNAVGDATTIQRALYVSRQRGIPADAMRGYLEREGFTAIAFRGEWGDLLHHLSRGRPLIVAFRTPGGTLHYAVAAGFSEDAIALNDPADRKLRKYDRSMFEKQWSATGYWTLLAVPRAK
jgi:ABC-type bacteriocin/lantibiotic exporter with double-glycine peptidase domain